MLNKNAEDRPTLEQIAEHKWVTNNGQEQIDICRIEAEAERGQGFGNLPRLLLAKQKGRASTSFYLVEKEAGPDQEAKDLAKKVDKENRLKTLRE